MKIRWQWVVFAEMYERARRPEATASLPRVTGAGGGGAGGPERSSRSHRVAAAGHRGRGGGGPERAKGDTGVRGHPGVGPASTPEQSC